MANITKYIDKITVPSGSDTITANLVDNASGYITGISSSDVTTALGYTPANKMIISRGTEITTGTYSINVSYSDIIAALSQGINPVFTDPDNTYPFVGYFVDNNVPLLVFGESVIVNGQAVTQGYMIPTGTSMAMWASQIQTIPTKTSDLNNDSGFITASDVPSAGTSATAVGTSASGGSATTWSKSDHVHSISSSTVTSALGYTPYNSTNPNGYTTNTGTVTSVAISGSSPISASGTVTSTGTLSVSHEASGVSAKTTFGVYPFKVNTTGHITEVDDAVTVKEPSYILTYNYTVDADAVQDAYNANIPIYVLYRQTTPDSTVDYLCPLVFYGTAHQFLMMRFGFTYLNYNTSTYAETANSLYISYSTTDGWNISQNDDILIPYATSELYNDAGFLTSSTAVTSFNGSTGAITYTAPVTSVNGSTGAVTGLQTTGNLVTSVSSSSTDSQYPSAKLFYDTVGNIESLLSSI